MEGWVALRAGVDVSEKTKIFFRIIGFLVFIQRLIFYKKKG
jgi:hypothetical protein